MCDAAIRPLPDATEVRCTLDGDHTSHEGEIRDYAFAGSVTTVEWLEDDRRTFHGEWPGPCADPTCTLPSGHRGGHA